MTALEQQACAGSLDDVSLTELAERHGTPCYVYSAREVRAACARVIEAISPLPGAEASYAVKANGNLALLRIIAAAGLGFDVGSRGELARVLQAAPELAARTCMTGPCKSVPDIDAAVDAQIAAIVCESPAELERVRQAAQAADRKVRIGVRINPDVDAGTHRHITTGLAQGKFGVGLQTAMQMMQQADDDSNLSAGLLHCHIGSQIASAQPLIAAAEVIIELRNRLTGEAADCAIDLGGGFGIGDAGGRPQQDVLAELAGWLAAHAAGISFSFQPGRSIVARAGLLLTRVEYVKDNHILVDAAMNDLLRPALYDARHPIAVVGGQLAGPTGETAVAGPVCETADFLARNISLSARPGDLIAVCDAGAYGFVMASNYNGRLRPCELLIDNGTASVVRRRETIADAIALEQPDNQ